MSSFKLREDLPHTTRRELDRITAINSAQRLQSEADFLTALAPYLVNEVLLRDNNNLIVKASGNEVPTGDSGFRKGATFIQKTATDAGLYTNDGDETSSVWSRVDTGSYSVGTETEDAPVNAVAAQGTITVSGTPEADETITIGATTFTFVAERSEAGEITIDANNATQVTNIVTAVTADSEDVTAVDGDGDTVVITAVVAGVSGDSLELTEAATGIAVNGSGTLGTTRAGVNGTPGLKGETVFTSSYEYICIVNNTIAGANWRRVSLGSAY